MDWMGLLTPAFSPSGTLPTCEIGVFELGLIMVRLLLDKIITFFMSRWPTYCTYLNHADFLNVSVFPDVG
jgi:hypothetical protein